MKKKVPKEVEKGRVKMGLMKSDSTFGFNGMFRIRIRGNLFKIISSDQLGWDHVSVSLPHRIPTWNEMTYIKRLFFDDEETVIQIHPPEKDYVNTCENCLHLWRCHDQEIKLPPKIML